MNREKNSTPFGERLKKVRGLKSQVDFAASLGITQRAVVNYETGGRIPRGNILRKICEQYGINEEWLLTGDGPMAIQGAHAELAGSQSVFVDGKMGDMSPILPQESKQPIENIGSEKNKMGDMSPILPQTLTSRCLRLADENAALLRENGDLRVEVERLRMNIERRDHRIAELERQLVEALKPCRGKTVLEQGGAVAGELCATVVGEYSTRSVKR